MNNINKPRKIDWKKKGLGWIPDYPDIRDYRTNQDKLIKKNGVVKKDEFTGAVEEIADKLIAVLNIIKNNQVSEQKDDNIEELVNSLQNKIFGNVSFITVKVRKILRQGSPPVKSNYFNPELTQFQANQILELKKYLYILVAKGLNTEVLKSPLVLEQGIDLDDPKELVKWLITNEFDETTKRLLMVFQCCADIKIDGILGLETYTALNEYFNAEPSKLQELGESQRPENKNKVNQILSGEISSPAETKVKLVSLPSLIPNEIFKVILDQLIKLEVVESDFYDNNSDDCLQEDFRAIILELTQFKWKKVFTPEKLQDFIDIAQKNFLFIEPIISLIINLTTPLAQFKSFEEAMEVGFKQLKPIINTSQTFTSGFISNSTINCLEDSKEYILSKVDAKKLAQLVQKMHARYYDSLNLLLRERKKPIDSNKLKDNASEIYFYVLLKKYIMGFNITALKQEEPLGESNIFSKQELLEIDNLAKNVETNTVEIFSTDPIQIPISKSLSFEKSVNCEPQLTPYLFLPSVVDLSYWCSAIEDQGSINSCTAFAASGLIEYFANKSQGKYTDVSPMFLYKAARNLMNVTGDVGASLRETMKAIALFGVPPEEFWKYEEDRVEDEPPAFCYSYAQNYQSLKYFRLDYAGISKETLLFQLKAVLAAGFPCMFGFTIYSSVYDEFNIHKGYIPFPDAVKDQVVGGHAVVAVGYDDFKEIPQADSKLISQGALLIRNSWGREWGCKGYGWLPYDYLLQGLTRDWWSLLKTEWFEADNFGFGARNFGVEDKNSDQP